MITNSTKIRSCWLISDSVGFTAAIQTYNQLVSWVLNFSNKYYWMYKKFPFQLPAFSLCLPLPSVLDLLHIDSTRDDVRVDLEMIYFPISLIYHVFLLFCWQSLRDVVSLRFRKHMSSISDDFQERVDFLLLEWLNMSIRSNSLMSQQSSCRVKTASSSSSVIIISPATNPLYGLDSISDPIDWYWFEGKWKFFKLEGFIVTTMSKWLLDETRVCHEMMFLSAFDSVTLQSVGCWCCEQ